MTSQSQTNSAPLAGWQGSSNYPAEKRIIDKVLQGEVGTPEPETNRNIRFCCLEYLLTNGLVPRQGIRITNAVVVDGVDFRNTDIRHNIELKNCEFKGKVNFFGTHFFRSAIFTGSVFDTNFVFEDAQVEGNLNVSEGVFYADANFTHIKVGADLDAGGTWFDKSATFTGLEIGHSVSFDSEGAVQLGDTELPSAISSATNVLSTNFLQINAVESGKWRVLDLQQKKAYLLWGSTNSGFTANRTTCVRGDLKLDGGSVAKQFTAWGAYFGGAAKFDSLKVADSVAIDYALFDGTSSWGFLDVKVQFSSENAEFRYSGKPVNFLSLRCGEFILDSADFAGGANFQNAAISGDLEAWSCHFESSNVSDFLGLKVASSAYFSSSVFDGPVRFGLAQIDGNFDATSNYFNDITERSNLVKMANGPMVNADFGSMKVGGTAFFNGTVFRRAVSFERANFQNLHLCSVRWQQTNLPSSTNAVRLEGLSYGSIRATKNDRSPMRDKEFEETWETLKGVLASNSSYTVSTYDGLEAYFEREGQSDIGDEIFYEGKVQERRQTLKGSRWKSFLSYVLQVTVGFGRKPWWAAGWSLGFILLGMLLFFLPYMQRKGERPREGRSGKDPAAHGPRLSPGGKFRHVIDCSFYTFDLFVPIIDLKTSDLWEPKPGREWILWVGYFYKILGFILIPIWAAALAGLVK